MNGLAGVKHDLYDIKIKWEFPEKLSKLDNSEIYPGVNEFKFIDIYSYQIDTSPTPTLHIPSLLIPTLPTPTTDGAHKKIHYKKSHRKKKFI